VVCAERVAARISDDEAAEVRAFLTAEAARIASSGTQNLYDFHVLVTRPTANPALHLSAPVPPAAPLAPHPILAGPTRYDVDAISTSSQRHRWDIHAV
jgi:hypothetical protein